MNLLEFSSLRTWFPQLLGISLEKKFHALLTSRLALDENAVPGHLWSACQDGLEAAFLEDKKKTERRMKKAVVALPVPTAAPRPQGSLFALLAEGTA